MGGWMKGRKEEWEDGGKGGRRNGRMDEREEGGMEGWMKGKNGKNVSLSAAEDSQYTSL
jgi:hypothetical protein